MSLKVFLAIGLLPLAMGNMYDVLMPKYLPPSGCTKCASWSTKGASIWAAGAIPADASNSCAMPAAAIDGKNTVEASFSGPWCHCEATGEPGTCIAPNLNPEQINLQLAEPTVLVASFVTYENAAPASVPVANLTDAAGVSQLLEGVSHLYLDEANHRNYTMHFVRLSGLSSREGYSYAVRSGAKGASWSDQFNFRAPYAAGATRVAIYGDMGNSLHNNMENLLSDCRTGAVDALVHMGDHAYDLGQAADRHGDAYMNAFQPVLSSCPWLPVIGNHESYLGPGRDKSPHSTTERYLNQTFGVPYGQQSALDTATTALGSLLTKGTFYGVGSHGSRPSGTSRYNSIDIGLFHIVGLDLDPGQSPDGSSVWALWNNSEGGKGASAQGLWLDQDLAAADANRANVPWVIVTSHFPLQHTMLRQNGHKSAAHYVGNAGEDSSGRAFSEHHFADCPAEEPDCYTIGQLVAGQSEALIPMMEKYNVDVYDAGHVHSYEVSWPQKAGRTTNTSFDHPDGIVYITEGNGGVPPTPGKNSVAKCTAPCRMKGTGGAYGRFIATDAHTLTYEHVENPTGKVTDTWAITK